MRNSFKIFLIAAAITGMASCQNGGSGSAGGGSGDNSRDMQATDTLNASESGTDSTDTQSRETGSYGGPGSGYGTANESGSFPAGSDNTGKTSSESGDESEKKEK